VCNETITHSGHGNHPVVLDLTHMSFIDADGVALFEQLISRQALTNCSVFVAEQREEVTNADR